MKNEQKNEEESVAVTFMWLLCTKIECKHKNFIARKLFLCYVHVFLFVYCYLYTWWGRGQIREGFEKSFFLLSEDF